MSDPILTLRGRKAALSRSRKPDDADLVDVSLQLRELRITREIRAAVDAWPPLTADQRSRLAALLGGG